MSPLERFPQEQTDAPSDSGALRLNLSGGGLCWRLPFCRAELHRALSAMLRAAGSGPAELDLVLVRDAGMADYNLRYMGCHGPTNVLSFPIDEQIAGRRTKTSPSSSGASSFPSTPCTGKRSCTGKIRRSIASGFWPTGSGIWPVTTTALKWMNCVPKCCLRQRLG